jgi:hypothetical protein
MEDRNQFFEKIVKKDNFSPPPTNESPFAEIIVSCLDNFTAQCWQWDDFPEFGSLVTVTEKKHTVFGCVVQVKTGSMDSMRNPFPYQKTEETLLAEQPQIFEFLKTTFTVQILGYKENKFNDFLYFLPPYPRKIHAFVINSSCKTYAQFFSNTAFLHLLFAFQNNISNLDDLLLAIMQKLFQKKLLNKQFFSDLYQTISLLMGSDYRRLKLFLKRVESCINL